jgi:hypothetical protein
MDVKIRVCLSRKYGCFMLFIDEIEKTTFRNVFANNSVFNLHFMKVSTENDNNFGGNFAMCYYSFNDSRVMRLIPLS